MSAPSGMFAGGLALGVLLSVGGMFGYSTYMAGAPGNCDGGSLCGEGTVCERLVRFLENYVAKALEAGATEYIIKPFESAALEDKLAILGLSSP